MASVSHLLAKQFPVDTVLPAIHHANTNNAASDALRGGGGQAQPAAQ
jgi:hypothetical protein